MSTGPVHVAELHVHPVKALRGGLHQTVTIAPWGLVGDRRWMAVDQAGRFLSQREHPLMALIQAFNTPDGIRLAAGSGNELHIPAPGPDAEVLRVQIWNDTVAARVARPEANRWLSRTIGLPCRLVYLADSTARPVNPVYAQPGDVVNFADGFPALLVSLGSLGALNAHLAAPVPIGRFRPGIVVEGAVPWEEDCWRRIRIGEAVFRVAKPSARCIVTTVDQDTGLRPDRSEPLRTLARIRQDRDGGAMFGQNLVPEGTGRIRVGDTVEVIERGPPNVSLVPAAEAGAGYEP